MTKPTALITGGAGYIGSHTCVELLNNDWNLVVVDNLSNSSYEAIHRVEKITGRSVDFIEADIRDETKLDSIFEQYNIDAVVHFAGFKAVGESCSMPLHYYDNNVNGTLVLTRVMQRHQVKNLVFSSSATVYGDPQKLPITETMPLSATNPYGRSKLIIEDMLGDLPIADEINGEKTGWQIVLLRYFNPVGAHESGLIGEDPKDTPNNLMPYISQVAVGKLPQLSVFGNDYDTHDGTGVRDYIHVVDLAKGHLAALIALVNNQLEQPIEAINLGTGEGLSVIDLVNCFSSINEVSIPYNIVERRPGDVAACYADAEKAKRLLSWETNLTVTDMVRDTWNWQSKNPKGYIDSRNVS